MSCGGDANVSMATRHTVPAGTSKSSGSQNMFIITCRSARAAETGDRARERACVRVGEARAVQRRAVPGDVRQAALVDRASVEDGCDSAGCALRNAIICWTNRSMSSFARPASSRTSWSGCPGCRRCCCRAASAGSRRRRAASARRATASRMVDEVLDLPRAQRVDRRIVGRPFDAAVPAQIVVDAVAIAFAVRLVVLVVV